MNRIRLLPEPVANQIAAGEVVERPASVVKELVENSLDAQPSRITVEIQAGGRSLIRVTDDGLGMNRDDALLCLERHATSKIRRAEDLAAIATMGFRGEALPSIASVSRFILTTCEREGETPEATQIVVNGGKITEVKSAGHAPGTTVEVRQLFHNLPVRRKFLRSEETERAHVQHYLTLAALAFPEVAFTFLQDQRLIWQLPALKTSAEPGSRLDALRERLRVLLGGETELLPVGFTADPRASEFPSTDAGQDALASSETPLRVWGFIGAPGVSRVTRQDQHLFVNRRPVENRSLNFALLEGYHTALMKGRYPVCCLFLEIDPAEVDVNIHPSKREVKFHRERDVRHQVAEAIRRTLLGYHTPGGAGASEAAAANITEYLVPIAPDQPAVAVKSNVGAPMTLPLPQLQLDQPTRLAPSSRTTAAPSATLAPVTAAPVSPAPRPADPRPLPSRERPTVEAGAGALLNVPLRLVGVIGRLYVVLESDRGMVLMDQHAAHERVLYEQMLRRLEQGGAPSQRLLLAETVELSPRDAEFLREHLAVLRRLGVGLDDFGERTFLLDALPPFVKAPDARRFVLELIDELAAAGREVNSLRLGEQTVAKTVCRHAVKANDSLNGPELENLIEDLRRCAMPYTCPHGRPTLVETSYRELERKFGRQQ